MSKGYHHLTRDQRCLIGILQSRKDPIATIANEIGVDRSTVYREINRNRGSKEYHLKEAQEKATERRRQASSMKRKLTNAIIGVIEDKLRLQWSPEQIAGWLKKRGQSVSHETIYRHVWEDKRQGGLLYKELRHSGKKYNKRSCLSGGRGFIPGRIDISERAAIVEDKSRLGDWELDTIIGGSRKEGIVSMVERSSKLTRLAKVSQKTAYEVKEALVTSLTPVKDFVLTLTSDNGKEFAYHKEISATLDTSFYFAKPYHAWERGLNEHTNGLVRQYLPKGKSFNDVTKEELMKIEKLLNNRPRKVLNFSTPLEVFNHLSQEASNVALQT